MLPAPGDPRAPGSDGVGTSKGPMGTSAGSQRAASNGCKPVLAALLPATLYYYHY